MIMRNKIEIELSKMLTTLRHRMAQNITDADIIRMFSRITGVISSNRIVPVGFLRIYAIELSNVKERICYLLDLPNDEKPVSMISPEDHHQLTKRLMEMLALLCRVIKPRSVDSLLIDEKHQEIYEMLLSLVAFFRDEYHSKEPLEEGEIQEITPMESTLEALAKRRRTGRTGKSNRFTPY